MPKEYLNPEDLPNWSGSFSQVVVVRTGSAHTVYVSGQVSVDAQNAVIGPGDLALQASTTFENLARALRAAGAAPADVVRLGIYVKDWVPDQNGIIREAMRAVFVGEQLPTSTWLGVSSLALEELLIEVEAVAVVESE